jgi:DNA-binding NarL/FixJ family response regulator
MACVPARRCDPEIAILVVDDHPALRAGLRELVDAEPGLRCVGTLPDATALGAAAAGARPDVVVLDYLLGAADGLSACFTLKQRPQAPGVVLYSAHAGPALAVPATMAQADAVVAKSAPAGELLAAIRRVAAGRARHAALPAEVVQAASARLDAEDLPVAGLLAGRTPVAEIARLLDLPPAAVRARALRILGRLQAADPPSRPLEGAVDGP